MKRLDTKTDRFWRTYVYHIIVIFGLPFLARKNINTRNAQVRTQCKIEFTSVPRNFEFQCGLRVVKMLSISMADNVISCKKNRKKHSKNQNRWFYNVNSAPELRNDQKWPKKRITQLRFTQFFCIGMVHFRCLMVNPHVQAVQSMCGKGG